MEFSLFAHMERIDEEQSQKRLYDEFVELCQKYEFTIINKDLNIDKTNPITLFKK